MVKPLKTLRLVLGDQLNYRHSWFSNTCENHTYLLIELKQESVYVTHHAQKIIGFFAAMYNFKNFLQKNGHKVIYLKINSTENRGSLQNNIKHLIKEHNFEKFEYLLPDEYRLDIQLKEICLGLSISSSCSDTEHFFTERQELKTFFQGKKTFLMENFYRYMRKKHNVLMDEFGDPIGGQWNFDSKNRSPYKDNLTIPPPFLFFHNYEDIWNEIAKARLNFIGNPTEKEFIWPTTRKQSLELLNYFCENLLQFFGKHQDAMHSNYWSLFHSRISFALNCKMISPKEVIDKCINKYEENPQKISIEQLEGFIRQIIGWREYMRGIYWAKMPEYKKLNYFNHQTQLPNWFWNGETKMNCLKICIQQSLQRAYAHHIQRLMIIGNFALLAGIDPDEVDKWYLGIYIDAIEWVEITNTRGMSQFADGGIVGSKPYVSSANYIDKMSNYCKSCYYNKTKRTGERACPFNCLYWNFHLKHRDLLHKNPRIGMVYKTIDRMKDTEKEAIKETAGNYLASLNQI